MNDIHMDVPNLQALVALEAVARLGSVTRTAAALHLTQSAVSHRLHSLQRELGVQLLEREGRGVALTPEARELARAASEALAQLNDAIARISPAAREEVLSIGCSPSFAMRFLVPRLSVFHKQHPELDLRIAASDVPIDMVHRADVAIHLSSGPTPKLYCEKLIDEVVFPVASPHLRRGRDKQAWTLGDLLQQTLLHDEALSDDPKRVGWSTWLAAAGVAIPRAQRARTQAGSPSQRSLTFSHAYLAIEAALAGDGVALARRSLVADDLARGRLIAPFPLSVPSGLSYWFVSARGPNPKQRPSVNLLRELLSQQLTAAERIANKLCGKPRGAGSTSVERPRKA